MREFKLIYSVISMPVTQISSDTGAENFSEIIRAGPLISAGPPIVAGVGDGLK